jgi:hypothetical protein
VGYGRRGDGDSPPPSIAIGLGCVCAVPPGHALHGIALPSPYYGEVLHPKCDRSPSNGEPHPTTIVAVLPPSQSIGVSQDSSGVPMIGCAPVIGSIAKIDVVSLSNSLSVFVQSVRHVGSTHPGCGSGNTGCSRGSSSMGRR